MNIDTLLPGLVGVNRNDRLAALILLRRALCKLIQELDAIILRGGAK